jgi:HAD superfamily hydrolase (TIGR01484 family)
MSLPIKLISTDFDGTLFAEFEMPPIPPLLIKMIGDMQQRGAKWVINTGRDMSSLMEALARAAIPIQPDYLVLVEREIHIHDGVRYKGMEEWNSACDREHRALFARVNKDVPKLMAWVNAGFQATVYADVYSPFCLIAGNTADAERIHSYLDEYSRTVPHLTVVRNDVYARFSHVAYNKGTALAEVARQLGIKRDEILVAGDHLNDLPMLLLEHARWLVAPSNAIEAVKEVVLKQGGFVSSKSQGHGVAEGLYWAMESALSKNNLHG